jgi:hypothetical protein
MTLNNKTGSADRLIGASSEAADKLQIHEMKVVNGVMQMRQLDNGLAIPARRIGRARAKQLSRYADRTEEAPGAGRNISADADFPKSWEYFRYYSGTRHGRDAG